LELLIPFGLVVMYGRWVGNIKQGLAIGAAMALLLIGATGIAMGAEQAATPRSRPQARTRRARPRRPAATSRARRSSSGRCIRPTSRP
jgi:K+-transporting ATPase A subunit